MKREELADNIVLYEFKWDFIESNMYVLVKEEHMLIIDPICTEETIRFFYAKDPKQILVILTHEHFDHINGLNWLKERYSCTVYANTVCAENIASSVKNLSNHSEVIMMFNKDVNPNNVIVKPFVCSADITFDKHMLLKWSGCEIEMVTTPGHTDGSICIIVDKEYIFTGDTLLDVPTIVRLPGGSKKKFLENTIPYLCSIASKNYRVFPGHGDDGRLGDMLAKYQ